MMSKRAVKVLMRTLIIVGDKDVMTLPGSSARIKAALCLAPSSLSLRIVAMVLI